MSLKSPPVPIVYPSELNAVKPPDWVPSAPVKSGYIAFVAPLTESVATQLFPEVHLVVIFKSGWKSTPV